MARHNHFPGDVPDNIPDSPGAEEPGGRRAFPFELSKDVSANSTETKSVDVPYDGRIVGVILGWPDGASNAVGAKLRTTTGQTFVPYNRDNEEFLAFNNFVETFVVRADVSKDETIVAEYKNNDANNSHFINCVPFIVEDAD